MKEYTIKFQYGPYSGVKLVMSDSEENATIKLWRILEPYFLLPTNEKSAKVIIVTNYNEFDCRRGTCSNG